LTPEGVEIERLRRRVVELTAAVEARDTFIAIAAHELRNPMMPIIGQIDLLRSAVRASRNTPKQIDNRLERLQQSMGHFVARAGILLDVSRITMAAASRRMTANGCSGVSNGPWDEPSAAAASASACGSSAS
jgi:signal transduction histidine kinase